MEKETERSTYVLQNDKSVGVVRIADDVVAMIAGIAATEVEGVSAMAGNITNELMSRVGMKTLTKGVKVDILGHVVTLDLAVNMDYGYNILAISKQVQEKVKAAIENMTGLTVAEINVRIVSINMSTMKTDN